MARTPYEVRLDTLCLAKDILSENAHAQRDNDRQMRDFIADGGQITSDDPDNPIPLFDDHAFTVDEVVAQAKKLYEFIAPEGDAPKAKF